MPKCLVLKGKHVVRKWPKQKEKIVGWEQAVLEDEHMASYVHKLWKGRYMPREWCVRKVIYRVGGPCSGRQ